LTGIKTVAGATRRASAGAVSHRPAWDAAVASLQRNLRGQLQLIRTLAADGVKSQLGESDTDLAAAGS
jgi:hypothetical protein